MGAGVVTAPRLDRPLRERVDRFLYKYRDIRISGPWATPSGKWEVSEPDCAAKAYDRGTDMMDDLEARYPSKP
jgi:hypothetical protein